MRKKCIAHYICYSGTVFDIKIKFGRSYCMQPVVQLTDHMLWSQRKPDYGNDNTCELNQTCFSAEQVWQTKNNYKKGLR